MELDDLKAAWTAHGHLLERSLAINERLLREVMLRKARSRMRPHLAWRSLEVALGVAVWLAVVSVLVAHAREPRYLVVVGILAVVVAGTTALSTYALVSALQLDYGGPVTGLVRGVEHVRRAEYRAIKWAVLGGVVAWLPAALVLFEAITGFPVLARVELGWVVANLAFGVLVLGLGQVLARRYLERPDLAPWARRVMDALSGHSVRAAAGHLAELARFERDED